MELTFNLPSTDEQGGLLLGELLAKCSLSEKDAQMVTSVLFHIATNKELQKVVLGFSPEKESDVVKYMRNCFLNKFIKSLVNNTPLISKECENAYVSRVYYASGGKKSEISIRRIASYTAKNALGSIRSKISRFGKQKLTTEFLKDYPSINPDALSYLHLKGKLKGTIEDFETLRNFLEIMIREPKKKNS